MTAATPDRAALHSALQDTLAMARAAQADLAVRECATMAPQWRGRALLWSLKARADELRAQISTSRRAEPV
jgi:hypothetical protein